MPEDLPPDPDARSAVEGTAHPPLPVFHSARARTAEHMDREIADRIKERSARR
ncbi:hypothetical protein [Nocardia cyriacigeorgica]|uniref:hypothetical protein n=1 Tax=Nocardia cyriacigeorgica TaxID=135487 RepID=UPI0014875475|nr:hypothetical protein [Nocardia cyriacigeorgica]